MKEKVKEEVKQEVKREIDVSHQTLIEEDDLVVPTPVKDFKGLIEVPHLLTYRNYGSKATR